MYEYSALIKCVFVGKTIEFKYDKHYNHLKPQHSTSQSPQVSALPRVTTILFSSTSFTLKSTISHPWVGSICSQNDNSVGTLVPAHKNEAQWRFSEEFSAEFSRSPSHTQCQLDFVSLGYFHPSYNQKEETVFSFFLYCTCLQFVVAVFAVSQVIMHALARPGSKPTQPEVVLK